MPKNHQKAVFRLKTGKSADCGLKTQKGLKMIKNFRNDSKAIF